MPTGEVISAPLALSLAEAVRRGPGAEPRGHPRGAAPQGHREHTARGAERAAAARFGIGAAIRSGHQHCRVRLRDPGPAHRHRPVRRLRRPPVDVDAALRRPRHRRRIARVRHLCAPDGPTFATCARRSSSPSARCTCRSRLTPRASSPPRAQVSTAEALVSPRRGSACRGTRRGHRRPPPAGAAAIRAGARDRRRERVREAQALAGAGDRPACRPAVHARRHDHLCRGAGR